MAYQAELRTAILVLHVMQCHRAAMCLDGSLTVGIHSNGSSCEYPMQQLLCTIGLMYCYIIVMQIPKQYGECWYEAERNQYDEVHTANALCLQVNVTSFRVLRHLNTTMHDNLFNFRRLIIGCSNCSFHQIEQSKQSTYKLTPLGLTAIRNLYSKLDKKYLMQLTQAAVN